MANTTKRIIQFQAQFASVKGFGDWINSIEKNIDDSVDKSFSKWIKEYKARLEALAKSINEMGDNPSDRGLARMRKEMNAMWTVAKKISNAFSSMSLGDDMSKEIETLLENVQKASTKVKSAKSGKRRWENKKGEDGVPLSDEELTRIYKQNTAKGRSITFNGQTFSGESDLARFLQEIKNNAELLKDSEEAIAVAIKTRVEEITTRIKEYEEVINTASQELIEANAELKNAQANIPPNGEHAQLAVEGQNWVARMGAANDASADAEDEHQESLKKQQQTQKTSTNVVADYNKENAKTSGVVAHAAKQVFAYGTVFSLFKRMVTGAKRTITELDKALTDMAVVTNLSRQEAWEMIGTFQALAKETGSTTSEIAQITTKFLQQGKSMTQALQLTEAASKAAKIAGIDGARSVDLLTNAMNGFQMSASQALEVSDKFAALAAASATDYEELAVALSKVAAQANLAGMSMDFTLGMLAKGIEVTREAPETIGTALKTVISRMRELTDYGETLEEGMDVNRVEKALENVGVQLRDTSGQFRNLEDVLSELGGKWNELNTNQQANVAVALAGTRQQSRLIAMMQDFDRTLELVDISTNSYGATMAQHMEYMGSMEAATTRLTTAYEGLISGLVNSDFIIGIVNIISSIVEGVAWMSKQWWLLIPAVVLFASWSAKILNNKILEHRYTKATHQVELLQTVEQNKQKKLSNDAKKDELIKKKLGLQNLKIEKQKKREKFEQTKITYEQLAAEAESVKDYDKAKQYRALALKTENAISALKKQEIETENQILQVDREIRAIDTENALLANQNSEAMASMSGFASNFLNILAGIPSLLFTILGIFKLITGEQTLQLALEKLKNTFKKKNIAATGKQATAETAVTTQEGAQTIMEGGQAGGKTGGLPGMLAGIAIAAGVVAAVAGVVFAIRGISSAVKEKEKSTTEGNIKAMQELQAEIYNLGQTANTISSLQEEFETLSSKINKTAEDTKRLGEIISEFNDTAGYDLLDSTMSYDEVLNKMRAYEASVTAELYNKIKESNETLKQATKTAAQLDKYLNNTEGRAVIQQNLAQNYKEFGNASETTKTLILDTIAKNTGSFVGADGGLNYDRIKSTFTTGDIDIMDTAVATGTLQAYKDALNDLSSAAQNYVKQSDSLFGHVKDMSDEVIKSVDGLKLTADQLSELSSIITDNKTNIQQWIDENGGELSRGELLNKLYQNRLSSDTAGANLVAAQQALQDYASTEEYEDFLKLQDEVEEKGGVEQAGFSKDKQQRYEAGLAKLGALQEAIEEAETAEKLATMTAQEWWNTYGNIPTLTGLQDSIDKANSSMEKFTKYATGELDAKEMDELMGTYPQLIDYMADGVVTAAELNKARNEIYEDQLEELETTLDTIETKNTELLKATGYTWETIKNMDYDVIHKMFEDNVIDEDIYNQILAAKREYQSVAIKAKNFKDALGLTEEELEKIAKSTGRKLAEAQYTAYKDELELYSENDPEYQALYAKSFEAASRVVASAAAEKDKITAEIQKQLGNYAFEIIDGQIFYKNEVGLLQSLDSVSDEIKELFAAIPDSLIESYEEASDAAKDAAQNIANDYVEARKKELEEEKEILEERKEAYEEYFEQVDALEEEQEREQSKESIIKQIAALSGGIDGASKSKIKDLQQQLADLEKEEAEAKKEEMRNELLADLDTQTQNLDDSMTKLDDSVGLLTRVMLANAAGQKFAYNADSTDSLTTQVNNWLKQLGLTQPFASGGLVNYTGFAAVHGSPMSPEAFLDAEDTALISALLESVHLMISGDFDKDTSTIEENNNSSIAIENINIQTQSLNNSQDFKNAGNALAKEFAKMIRDRGINVNVKK